MRAPPSFQNLARKSSGESRTKLASLPLPGGGTSSKAQYLQAKKKLRNIDGASTREKAGKIPQDSDPILTTRGGKKTG